MKGAVVPFIHAMCALCHHAEVKLTSPLVEKFGGRLLKGVVTGMLVATFTIVAVASAQYDRHLDAAPFITYMHRVHGFELAEVRALLAEARRQPRIIELMEAPAEGLPWFEYRKIFLTPERIQGGIDFMSEHQTLLAQAEAAFCVPAPIIVAIIGVETFYGRITGSHRVLDALATLGFDYPPRGHFFLEELEHYLLLAREEGFDPTEPIGSYAGAMGIAQFIPSSYRRYAVDFSGDGRRDLFSSPADAIGSIGNYLKEHGWRAGEGIATPAEVNNAAAITRSRLTPVYRAQELLEAGVVMQHAPPFDAPVGLLEFETETGPEYWVGKHNFFVITTYNRSPLYAMAVFQLAEALRE